MSKKIVITGATGFIGNNIAKRLIREGNRVTIVSRSAENARLIIPGAFEYIKWNYKTDPAGFVNEKDVVIHLMGENIMARRWTGKHKREVINSRVESTRALVKGIENAEVKPELFIHSSAIGFYGNGFFEADEKSKKGNGFLADVVSAWENEAAEVEKSGVRRVSVRLGIVLDKNEGALKKMILPFKFFMGGPLGSGKQWFPWVSIDDAADIFRFVIEKEEINGPVNAVAPEFIDMKKFATSLGTIMKRPSFFRVPEFALKLILGEAAEALIYGVKVIPAKLVEHGFSFEHKRIDEALKSIL